jgi:YD repeat-containing protein
MRPAHLVLDQRGREIRKVLHADDPAYPDRLTWTEIDEYGEADGDNLKRETSHGPAPGSWTRREYDPAGREVLREDACSGRSERTYNERGLLVRESVRVAGDVHAVVNHAYDDLSREVLAYRGDDPAREPRAFTYDIFSRKIREEDAGGGVATYAYDLLDHLEREERALEGETSLLKRYGRDLAGRMVSLYLAGDATPVRELSYSGLGHPLTVLSHPTGNPADDLTSRYLWDAAGRMTGEEDREGNAHSYAYDSLGLLELSRDPLGNRASFAYDREGRMTARRDEDPSGNPSSFLEQRYTPFGELKTRTFSHPLAQGGQASEEYAYDDYGRLVSVSCPSVSVGDKSTGISGIKSHSGKRESPRLSSATIR